MASATALEAAWARRVGDNRGQVERRSEVEPASDFYAPSVARFVEDPRRADDPVLDALRGLARPTDTWIDVGAGAGRFALPLALSVREVVAVEPSARMRDALRAGMTEHSIENIRIVDARWPMDEAPTADAALIAHVGYDIERIGPFLDALERAATRVCVAVMMQPSPAAAAAVFWPPVHGEERVPLPALDDLVALLQARGVVPAVTHLDHSTRAWPDGDAALTWLRGQLWIAADTPADARLVAAFREIAEVGTDGVRLPGPPPTIGVVTWPGTAMRRVESG